jgi:long-chain acyl-CoA synthetase
MSIRTLSELFLVAAQHDSDRCMLEKVEGRWTPISTAELVDRVRRLARALADIGIHRGDRVALMAENSPAWATIDFATLCLGAVTVPVYPTLLPEGAAYVVRDSGARILFVSGRERLEGLLEVADDMPDVEQFVLIDRLDVTDDRFTTLHDLVEGMEDPDPEAFEQTARKAEPDDLATLIYTSGTTGNPKGVMLTHHNITSNVLNCLSVMDIESSFTALSFLPLSHSFERSVDYIYFYRGVTVAYAESIQAVAQNLGEVRPHVFVSVPRVYEKVLGKVYENVAKASGVQQRIFEWAVETGKEALLYRLRLQNPPGFLGLKLALADRLVFGKIRSRLGGRFEFAMSGGAPLAREIAEFFWGAGIRIYEGYGLTETSPVLTVNTPDHTRLGTVGRAIPEVELKIAEDGEILARGPNIMQGYYNNEEATRETLDDDGWFHTGDVGAIDEDGFLSITDRKKELIVNAYGKNIAPAPIENALKASRYIGQAVIIGDRRKFLSALVVPDFEALEGWAHRRGITAEGHEELLAHPEVKDLLDSEVAGVNAQLARYEQIHAWEVLPNEFTLETGELTPTQKVKRRVIHDKYQSQIDHLYQAADAGKAAGADSD